MRGGSFPTVSCSSQMSNSFKYLTIPAAVTTGSSVVVVSSVSIYAPLFQLHMQATDVAARTSGPTPGPGPTNGGNGTNNNNNQGSSGGGGLSPGAAAGIGVGCAVLAMAGILGGVLLWRKRRKPKPPVGDVSSIPPEYPAYPPTQTSYAQAHAKFGGEMETPPPQQQAVYEAPAGHPRAQAELP